MITFIRSEEMLNWLLQKVGLVTIQRAKRLTRRAHKFYVASVVDGVYRDFGANGKPGAIEESCKWWDQTFDKIMAENSADISIASEPVFSDYLN
jgi:hypothetical protein